jgi:hypothetical protein
MAKKPTAAQARVLSAINNGDRLLFFVRASVPTREACRLAGWIKRDDLGNHDLTESGRTALTQPTP